MNFRRYVVLLVVAVLLGAIPLATPAQSGIVAQNTIPPVMDEFTQVLARHLTEKGFQVSQGYPMVYTMDDCHAHSYPAFKNCFQANPAAPYVLPVVKSWPDEYVDPAVRNGFVETLPGYSATFRLDLGEAIVLYGKMPPEGRYMGLQTWEFSQHGRWRPKDYSQWASVENLPFPIQYLFDTIPPDDPQSQRSISLSALGDVINNAVMERKSGDPFGQTRYFIITPSDATNLAVRSALQAQGVSDDDIFTEQIPARDDFGPIGPLGMGKNAIDFFAGFRYAVPDVPADAEAWRTALPLTVLRVRAPASLAPLHRYSSLVFAPRTAVSEDYLAGDLKDLIGAVCSSLINDAKLASNDCVQPLPASTFIADPVIDLGWVGPYCRDIGMDCEGDQQEAAYFASSPRSVDGGQVYAIVGTLATETGNATYVGLSANDASIMGGIKDANILDTGLKGSADGFSTTVGDTGKLFVHYFTRNCSVLANVPGGIENCTEITDEMLPQATNTTAQGDPALHGMIMVTLRDYIAPGEISGPDSTKLQTPRILTFTEP